MLNMGARALTSAKLEYILRIQQNLKENRYNVVEKCNLKKVRRLDTMAGHPGSLLKTVQNKYTNSAKTGVVGTDFALSLSLSYTNV